MLSRLTYPTRCFPTAYSGIVIGRLLTSPSLSHASLVSSVTNSDTARSAELAKQAQIEALKSRYPAGEYSVLMEIVCPAIRLPSSCGSRSHRGLSVISIPVTVKSLSEYLRPANLNVIRAMGYLPERDVGSSADPLKLPAASLRHVSSQTCVVQAQIQSPRIPSRQARGELKNLQILKQPKLKNHGPRPSSKQGLESRREFPQAVGLRKESLWSEALSRHNSKPQLACSDTTWRDLDLALSHSHMHLWRVFSP